MNARGTLFIISAPSGAGKTSLVRALIKTLPNICCSISYTTRPKRSQEQEGIDYYFISETQFKSMLSEGFFLEYAQVFGNFYGTLRDEVEKACSQGIDIILEIDWQGARQVRTLLPQAQSIYILPLSPAILLARLQNRHPENDEIFIAKRMNEAKEQMSHYQEYDYLIFNDNFEEALEGLKSIIRCHRLEQPRQQTLHRNILENLLS